MYFISQLGEHDCAFACLKMMLANFHHDKNYLYLQNEEDREYTYTELINIAEKHHLSLLGVKVSSPEELFKSNSFPIMVTLSKKRNVKHNVLVLHANPRYVRVLDPNVGKRKINTELFFKEWNGRALILKEVIPTKCQEKFPDFIHKKDKIILPIIQVLSGVSLLLGTYFVSGNQMFYLPVIFFSLFIIFELLFRLSLVKAMKRMDELIYKYEYRTDGNYTELYKTVEKYRTIALTITPNFIYASLISLFVSVILAMNDPVNLIYVMVPLALAAIEVFLYNPYFRAREIEIAEKETDINDAKDDFEFKMKSSEVHKSAYQLGLNRNIFIYIEAAILLLTIILSMVITHSINLTYIVFYLCITILLKTNFTKMLEYNSHSEEFVLTRAKLINYLNLQSNNS